MRISKDQQIADMKRDRARRDADVEIALCERILKGVTGWGCREEAQKALDEAKTRLKANG